MEHISIHPHHGSDPLTAEAHRRSLVVPDARFASFVHQRRAFVWTLTCITLIIYFGFILTLAFDPALLGRPIWAGQPMTWGIPVGFGMFVITFALVAVYVRRANTVFDRLVEHIIKGDAS